MLSKEVIDSISKSVLCWLSTSSKDNVPNVSPKEVFTHYKNNIIIANIASPQSIRNIKQNPNVCISFIDILVQKGFQLKGKAQIISRKDQQFLDMEKPLLEITKGIFPFSSIIFANIESIKPIIAPKYILYPDTTEQDQIESAKKAYGLK